MSIDSSKSRMNGGSGTIISSTTAMTAAGASSVVNRRVRDSVAIGSEHQLFDANEVREDFGHRAEQRRRNHVADFGGLVERAGERDVFDDRHALLARDLTNFRGQMVLSLRQHHRRAHRRALV